jgi:adenylosuccinate lyase
LVDESPVTKSQALASGVFDDALFRHLWTTDELRATFSDGNRVRTRFDFEAALARRERSFET